MKYIIILHLFAFLINIWFGYLRHDKRKFSLAWFIYIHLSIPLIVPLRLFWGIHPMYIPSLIICAIGGQLVGARFISKCIIKETK